MKISTVIFICLVLAFSNAKSMPEDRDHLLEFISSKTNYVIDDVLKLLKDLWDQAKLDQQNLVTQWGKDKKQKESTISDLKSILSKQQQACSVISKDLSDTRKELSEVQLSIKTKTSQIAKNNEDIKRELDERCKANQRFIDELIDQNNTLLLLNVIRQAVNEFQGAYLQIDQLKSFDGQLGQFLDKVAFLDKDLPDVQMRTDKEIGKGHIDNKQGKISVSSLGPDDLAKLAVYKKDLVKIVDDLEAATKKAIAEMQDKELQASELLAELKEDLRKENRKLTAEIAVLKIREQKLINTISQLEQALKDCQAKLTAAQNAVAAAEKDLQDATAQFTNKNNKLSDQIKLFEEVYNYYKEHVYSISADYKARSDDYIEDKKFDKTSNTRETEGWNKLKGQVSSSLSS